MSRRSKGQHIETWAHYRYKGEKAEIYLDKENATFFAEYGESILRYPKLEELRNELAKLVESMMKLDWIPVICISIKGNARFHRYEPSGRGARTVEDTDSEDMRVDRGSADFDIHFERFWLAKQPSGEWLSCDIWHSEDVDGQSDRYDAEKSMKRPFHAPMPRRLNSRRFYLHGDEHKNFTIPYKQTNRSFNECEETNYVKYTEQLWAGLNEVAFKVEELKNKLAELIGSERGLMLVAGLVNKMLPPAKETDVKDKRKR